MYRLGHPISQALVGKSRGHLTDSRATHAASERTVNFVLMVSGHGRLSRTAPTRLSAILNPGSRSSEGIGPDMQSDKIAVWRDRVLLLSIWIVAMGAALGAWAYQSQTINLAGKLFGSTLWARVLLTLHTGVVFALLLSPLLVAGVSLVPALRARFEGWMSSPLRLTAILVTLAAIGLAQALYFFDIGRLKSTLEFAVVMAVTCLAYLLFYGPDKPSARMSVAAAGWTAMIIFTRLTLQPISWVIATQPGTLWAELWAAVHVTWMVLLILGPLLAVIPRLLSPLIAFGARLEGLPPWIALLVFACAALATIAYRVAGEGTTNLWAFQRFMGDLAILVGCIMTLRFLDSKESAAPNPPSHLHSRWFWGSLSIVGVAYSIQAVRIGLNALYSLNPDGVAYMTIARDFGRGIAVIRGNWSPLMPLLLAPAIRFGSDPQVAQRVFVGAGGLIWIGLTLLLGRRAGLSRYWSVALAATMAIITLELTFFPVTPDLLSAVTLACYFLLVTHERFLDRPVLFGVLAGVLGALAFYAKFYNLPFFIAHVLITGVLIAVNVGSWKKALAATLAAWAVAALLITPWVLALRSRYGYFTLTTSGAINHAVQGPSHGGHPCWDQRLCDKPSDVLIPYEDTPAEVYADFRWNVFASMDNLRYQIMLTQGTIGEFLGDVAFQLGPLPPIAMIFVVIALFSFRTDVRMRHLLAWSLMTVVLYVAGYMLFHNELRYFLPILPVAIISLYRILQAGFERAQASGALTRARLARSVVFGAAGFSFLFPQAAGLRYLPPDDHCVARTVAQFADKLVPPMAGSDRWINIIAYYSGKRTLGVLPPGTSAPDANSEFRRLGVRTYVVGEGLPLGTALLERGGYSVAAETNLCGNRYLVLRTPVP